MKIERDVQHIQDEYYRTDYREQQRDGAHEVQDGPSVNGKYCHRGLSPYAASKQCYLFGKLGASGGAPEALEVSAALGGIARSWLAAVPDSDR